MRDRRDGCGTLCTYTCRGFWGRWRWCKHRTKREKKAQRSAITFFYLLWFRESFDRSSCRNETRPTLGRVPTRQPARASNGLNPHPHHYSLERSHRPHTRLGCEAHRPPCRLIPYDIPFWGKVLGKGLGLSDLREFGWGGGRCCHVDPGRSAVYVLRLRLAVKGRAQSIVTFATVASQVDSWFFFFLLFLFPQATGDGVGTELYQVLSVARLGPETGMWKLSIALAASLLFRNRRREKKDARSRVG